MKMKLWALPILLLCLCVTSWGACTTYTRTNDYSPNCCGSCSFDYTCRGSGTITLTGSCSQSCIITACRNAYCSYGSPTAQYDAVECSTQAEADSVACESKPGMHWVDGVCSAPVCETNCSSQKASCTDWKDSVTYTVDAGTGDTTFSCVGYCKTARMTHTDSVEAMDDSLSIIYRSNFADSVKVSYGANCASPADTTGGGNPQDAGMTYFVSFNGVENELDTAGVSFIKGLYNQSCESTLYRGIKNGRYVFWYSPNDIPEGVTNVVRIR